jgi:hydroxymethylpyrimidine/phosphomethylpyrimidine kinase
MTPPIVLTIAGSDPSGGAGIQGDLKTFHQHGAYGTAVITLLTAQSSTGVARTEVLDPELVAAQLDVLLDDVTPVAAKTGALGSLAIARVVAGRVRAASFPLVVDPVLASKNGERLGDPQAVLELLPVAALITPNAIEAGILAGMSRQIRTAALAREAAEAILGLGARAVLVKGGHLSGPPIDVLATDDGMIAYPGKRLSGPPVHGTGCALSAAIVAQLARGLDLEPAIVEAKAWTARAIRGAPRIGKGVRPVAHHTPVRGTIRTR